MSKSYSKIKAQPISDYGSADRKVSDIIVELTPKKCLSPGTELA